ncbi:hypothetical protein AWENTII_012150 [Aspergillus wentii]
MHLSTILTSLAIVAPAISAPIIPISIAEANAVAMAGAAAITTRDTPSASVQLNAIPATLQHYTVPYNQCQSVTVSDVSEYTLHDGNCWLYDQSGCGGTERALEVGTHSFVPFHSVSIWCTAVQ